MKRYQAARLAQGSWATSVAVVLGLVFSPGAASADDSFDFDCRSSLGCSVRGYCTAQSGMCVAYSDADCQQSSDCSNEGRCSTVHGHCLATSNAQCQESRGCKTAGRCTAVRGHCVTTNGGRGHVTAAPASSASASNVTQVGYVADAPQVASAQSDPSASYDPAEPDPATPPAYPPMLPDSTQPIPYREGDPIPAGYRVESTPRYGLVAGGAAVLGSAWLISMVSAISLDAEESVDDDPNFDDMYTPMFIPVVGPFITIGTADASGTGAGILALDGVVQSAGLAMFIAGFAAPTLELVPAGLPVTVTPMASTAMTGVSVSGEL